MDTKTRKLVIAHLKAAAEIVKAALIQVRAECPGESPQYYDEMLTAGPCFVDEEFESELWGQIGLALNEQLGLKP